MANRPTINVIDMYHGNAVPDPDFAALKANGIFGIIHKASQGIGYRDPAYAERRVAAQAAGLLWGAYHFLDSSDPKAQADFFLDCSGATKGDPIMLACDYENSPRQPSLWQCANFMREVDSVRPEIQSVLYSGNLIRETLKPQIAGHQATDMLGIEMFFQQHRLWLAEYGPQEKAPSPWCDPIIKSSDGSTPMPAPGVWLWQFTEKGRFAPLQGLTDGNFFDGTFDQLSQRWLK